MENKRADTGQRFVLQRPEEGNAGHLLWQEDRLPALIDWKDPVVAYGLAHRIKYARLIVRQASSAHAHGADALGNGYFVQLVLEGVPYQKPKHQIGHDTVGLDLGPSTIAIVPREGEARLDLLCADLLPQAKAIGRLQRRMERQRRANNPENYDAKGRVKHHGKQRLRWKHSQRYRATRRRKATKERKIAAHRKSLHGHLVHQIVAVGNTVITEKLSYRARPQQFGKSVGLRAPGLFITLLGRDLRLARAAPWWKFPRAKPNSRNSVMAAERMFPSRCGSVGTSAPVASRRSVTSIPRCWPPIWIQQICFPRVPGTRGAGKVGSPACEQHTSTCSNARKRGRSCPEA